MSTLERDPQRTLTADGAITISDKVIHLDTSSNDVQAQLPPASGNKGISFRVVNVDSTNEASVLADGTDTIEGAANEFFLSNEGDTLIITCDGVSSWS